LISILAKKAKEKLNLRTPIVAVMGHVDHGKTSLLDAIRGTQVQAGEVGGITQNTRAHNVDVSDKAYTGVDSMTFIDTPGHEAFAEMRSRGARIADFAMLVVAADDGVQPQTEESIKFINKNNIPVIVACNKMDLPGANPDKVKQELSQFDILVEEYGGDALFIEVSATEGEGIDEILENVAVLTEINELKIEEPVKGDAEGYILESHLDTDLGAVGLAIIKTGKIEAGDYLIASHQSHKIRATLDEYQSKTESAKQGEPTWLIGLNDVLSVGENFIVISDRDEAEELVAELETESDEKKSTVDEDLADKDILANLIKEKEERRASETNLKVILKADTQGTLEAVESKIEELSYEDARVSIFSAETGDISEKDVEMARDISGIVIGFQVDVDSKAMTIAKNEKILVRTYKIIYDLIDEIDAVVENMIEPEEGIEEIAKAEVKQVFTLSDGTQVAGCVVTKGKVIKGYSVLVERKQEEIADTKIVSLKQGKEDVKEVKKGMECGIMLAENVELNTGDEIICYKIVKL
jgi:translation initiation factor IF-2